MIKTNSRSHSKALGYEALGTSLKKVCIYCGTRLAASRRRDKTKGKAHQCEEMKASRKPSASVPFS